MQTAIQGITILKHRKKQSIADPTINDKKTDILTQVFPIVLIENVWMFEFQKQKRRLYAGILSIIFQDLVAYTILAIMNINIKIL